MTTISKRDALELATGIKRAKIAGHAIAERVSRGIHDVEATQMAGFIGGLDSVLRHFIATHAGADAGAAVEAAMSYEPTPADIAKHNAGIAALFPKTSAAP